MKKILSILLAMVMIMSSITVAFVTFAATADPVEAVEKINAQSAYVSVADNGDGTSHKLPGYTFSRKFTAASVNIPAAEKGIIDSIMANKYPEYASEPYHTEKGGYDYGAILKNLVGLSEVNKTVKMNSDASLTLGRDALKSLKLDPDKVKKATRMGTAAVPTYVLDYKDIDLAAGERVEDSVLAEITANYPQATGLDKVVVNSLKSHDTALTPSDFSLKIQKLKVTAKFTSDGKLAELSYTYELSGKVSLTYVDPTPFDVTFTLKELTKYNSFTYYNEASDFDYAELAKMINDATANMVDTKAGYDYARYNEYEKQTTTGVDENGRPVEKVVDYIFTLNTAELLSSNAVLSTAFGTILGYVDQIQMGFDEKLGTDFRASKWVCKNADSSDPNAKKCTSADPHQVWNCTCKDVKDENGKVCCSCCSEGVGCTPIHPCDKSVCSSLECKCGYITDPGCKYEYIEEKELSKLDANVANIFATIGSAMNGSIGKTANDKFAIGTTTANIAATTDPANKLDKKFTVKATELDVFDIDSANFDPTTKAITFKMADQSEENGYRALSHLTNDYITNEDFVKAINASFANSISPITDKLEITAMNATLVYKDVNCVVKFVGATDDNMYGTGEIESINLSYNMKASSDTQKKVKDENGGEVLYSNPIVNYIFETKMKSTVKNVDYPDYEKGDVNMDTSVSLKDAKLVLRYVAELETLNDYQMLLADMNEDKAVTIVDAKAILEKIASQTA